MQQQRNSYVIRKSGLFLIFFLLVLLSACAVKAEEADYYASFAPPPMRLPTPTVTPTPKPTPTPTLTPTPTPTPAPIYIEPSRPEPVWYNGYVDPRTIRAEIVQNPDDIEVLINKYYAVSEDYKPELVLANNSAGQYLHPEAAEAWDALYQACREETGRQLYLISGYRSYAHQHYSFFHSIERHGLPKSCRKNAYPGRSEHNLGLALDINTRDDPEIRDAFAETSAGRWVNENGHLYGFILRYPRGKGHITGYDYEAWHYRYVGPDLATHLYENDLTLEEYYGKEQQLP